MFDPNSLIGMRVELSPSTDMWMRGARYGEIVKAGKSGMMHVKLDATGRVVRIHADLIQPI
jgi:hypothetical protein